MIPSVTGGFQTDTMKNGDYGVRFEQVSVSPMSVNERALVKNAKNEHNRRSGERLTNREFRKMLLVEGSKRILTDMGDSNDKDSA